MSTSFHPKNQLAQHFYTKLSLHTSVRIVFECILLNFPRDIVQEHRIIVKIATKTKRITLFLQYSSLKHIIRIQVTYYYHHDPKSIHPSPRSLEEQPYSPKNIGRTHVYTPAGKNKKTFATVLSDHSTSKNPTRKQQKKTQTPLTIESPPINLTTPEH